MPCAGPAVGLGMHAQPRFAGEDLEAVLISGLNLRFKRDFHLISGLILLFQHHDSKFESLLHLMSDKTPSKIALRPKMS